MNYFTPLPLSHKHSKRYTNRRIRSPACTPVPPSTCKQSAIPDPRPFLPCASHKREEMGAQFSVFGCLIFMSHQCCSIVFPAFPFFFPICSYNDVGFKPRHTLNLFVFCVFTFFFRDICIIGFLLQQLFINCVRTVVLFYWFFFFTKGQSYLKHLPLLWLLSIDWVKAILRRL